MKPTLILIARHRRDEIPRAISPHPLRYTELTLLYRGEMTYYAGETALPLRGGDAVFLPKGTLRARAPSDRRADYLSFNFTTEEPIDLPLVIRGGVTREIRYLTGLFDEMVRERRPESAAEKTEHLLSLFLLSLADELRARQTHPVVRQIDEYLRAHLAERVTLSDAAASCCLSPVYCDTLYKKETGAAVMETLLAMRVEEAKLLLAQGQYRMSEIAAATGFRDPNYFARCFRKRTGTTPSAYRAEML